MNIRAQLLPPHDSARSILLVEDNPDDRVRIHRMLRGHQRQYEIVDCVNGAEALALIERNEIRFDCVLLDYNLPDMNGAELLRRLGGAVERLPVAVSVITGDDDDTAAALSLDLGAEDYLLKDEITSHALMRSIENVAERFGIRQQLHAQRVAIEQRNEHLELLRAEVEAQFAELTTATQARDRVVAMMSHDMRTPLNAILGYAQLLALEIDGPINERQRCNLKRIGIGSRHLLDLVNNVLDLARADAHTLELDLRPIDAHAMIEEIAALLEHQASEKALELRHERDASLPILWADALRLRQILTNLVGNAIKFSERGRITLTAQAVAGGEAVSIRVSDHGIGIEPQAVTEVFKEFYRAENAVARRHEGSGLGLAISQRLAHAMGGSIELVSTAGEGSVFTLTLPAANEINRGSVAHVEPAPGNVGGLAAKAT